MSHKLSLEDLDFRNKKTLIRVDFNVPMENGIITDDTRIRASLPTIQYVLEHGGEVILMSHLGRPQGKPDPQYSLVPCAKRLSELLKKPVRFAKECKGAETKKMADELKPGEILLLENLRFHEGEEKPDKDPAFVKELAELGDVYINDAFGTAHRAHASTAAIAKYFPGKAAAGYLMLKEIAYLNSALLHPKRPFCAILGGAKISTKFKVIEVLMQKADLLLIGGAMAFTFFKAQNLPIGNSLVEDEYLDKAGQLLDSKSRCRVLLPSDIVEAEKIDPHAKSHIVKIAEGIDEGFLGVDIGPETIRRFTEEIQKCATVFWNGPMGVFECPPFDHGTNAIAKALANLQGATTVVGGGDSAAAIEKAGYADKISHLSTGGGATLEYIEQGFLPGIEALSEIFPL